MARENVTIKLNHSGQAGVLTFMGKSCKISFDSHSYTLTSMESGEKLTNFTPAEDRQIRSFLEIFMLGFQIGSGKVNPESRPVSFWVNV